MQTQVGQITYRGVKIPNGNIQFHSQVGQVGIGFVTLLAFISFGYKDRYHTLCDQCCADGVQVFPVAYHPVRADVDEYKRRLMQAQLAVHRRLDDTATKSATVPERREQPTCCGAVLDGGAFPVEGPGKKVQHILEIRWQGLLAFRVGFVNTQESFRLALAIPEDGKSMRVVAKLLTTQVDGADILGHNRQNGPGSPISRVEIIALRQRGG